MERAERRRFKGLEGAAARVGTFSSFISLCGRVAAEQSKLLRTSCGVISLGGVKDEDSPAVGDGDPLDRAPLDRQEVELEGKWSTHQM